MRNQAPVLAPLFRSEAQALLLSELLLTAEELSMTDLAERAGLPYPTVHREVGRLLEAGLLVDRRVGRTRLIRGNEQSPLLAPTREILLTVTGPVVLIREALAGIGGVENAFLFGSFAARAKGEPGPPPNDIDLMVIGSLDVQAVYRVCREVSDSVGRIVNPTIMSPEEAEEQTGFLEEVRANPVIEIYGGGPDARATDAGAAEGG
ncbi:MarR family transcriptional regulator [Nocardioides panzhihuensis]|uniref:DNA-binding transcriptional ArsR family regulator n=1 Tax=Nocardioides panzhihuensis TaxID=860243 RepID=A0A7Z0DHZ6_9ACTN|nr:DNA-binding transcriptional ArsR family regulator [Nocardioides panzhihuensis]